MHAMTMAFGSTFNDLDLCSLVSVSISARVINNLRSGTFHVPLLFSKKVKVAHTRLPSVWFGS